MKRYIIAAAALAAVPGAAYAQDFTGPRVEARLGYETPTVRDDTGAYKIGSAVMLPWVLACASRPSIRRAPECLAPFLREIQPRARPFRRAATRASLNHLPPAFA